MRFLLLCFPPPSKGYFKQTASTSHLSVCFLHGTFSSRDNGFKADNKQRQLLHIFCTHRNKGSQMGIDGSNVTRLPEPAMPPFVSQAGPQNSSTLVTPSQFSLFLYATHTSIYLTCFPKTLTLVIPFQRKFYFLPQEGKEPKQQCCLLLACLFSDRVLGSQIGLQFSTAFRVTL